MYAADRNFYLLICSIVIKKMKRTIAYSTMRKGEEDRVFDLVKSGFDEFVLPDLTEEGAKEFFRAAREMIYDRPAGHVILVAQSSGNIVGMIDIRDNSHICLFFVARAYQGKGIGRGLLDQAIALSMERDPAIATIDVNSSLFAEQAYRHLGFQQSKPAQSANGIRFVPMIKALRK
jgi:GNAT superfamily N-acetyltransferase